MCTAVYKVIIVKLMYRYYRTPAHVNSFQKRVKKDFQRGGGGEDLDPFRISKVMEPGRKNPVDFCV